MLAPWPLVPGPCSLVPGFEMSNISFKKLRSLPLFQFSWPKAQPKKRMTEGPTKSKTASKNHVNETMFISFPLCIWFCKMFVQPRRGRPLPRQKCLGRGLPWSRRSKKWQTTWRVIFYFIVCLFILLLEGGAGDLFAPIGQPKGWLETKSGKINV